MKFLIITPSFNRHEFLEETIQSVVSQKGDFEIEYIIQDGGSDNKTIEIIRAWKEKLDSEKYRINCNRVKFDYFIEQDHGMYDALNKGFSKGNGDVMAWINSDDKYFPGAFQAINQAFKQNNEVDWLIGAACSYNRYGSVTGFGHDANVYSRFFIAKGLYREENYRYGFNWLSQDSMFWKSTLWNKTSGLASENKLTSDFLLWQEFSKHTDLVKIDTYIAGYRFHGNQLTGSEHAYTEELGKTNEIMPSIKILYALSKTIPFFSRLLLSKRIGALILKILGIEQGWIIGKKLIWDTDNENWRPVHCRILP